MEITKEQQKIYDQQCKEAFDALDKYYSEITDHNDSVLKELGIPEEDFVNLLDDSNVTDKISLVENPQGSSNHAQFGVFKAVWVDQWSVGMEGDSFEGFIYAKLEEKMAKNPI